MRVINEDLIAEFRAAERCEVCGKPGNDPHHCYAKGMGGGGRIDVRINLITLCRWDHGKVHDGHLKQADLLKIVAKRERTTVPLIRATIAFIRRLKKGSPLPWLPEPPKRQLAPGNVCRLVQGESYRFLLINGQAYVLIDMEACPGVAMAAWRLGKPDGTTYDVHVDRHGCHCSCADSVYRRQNRKDPCKHCRALKAVGLIPETTR